MTTELTWVQHLPGIETATDHEGHHIYFRMDTGVDRESMAPLAQQSQDAAILVTVLQRYVYKCRESGDHWRLTPPNDPDLEHFDATARLEIDGDMEVWSNEYPALRRLLIDDLAERPL